MVTTSRSAVLRRAGSFLTLLAFEIAAVVVLTRLGSVRGLRIPWHNVTPWLLNSPVEDVLAAVLRTIALLIAWWLLGSNLLYLLASLTRVPSAISAVRWLTLPMVRRATDHAVALTLATSLIGAGAGTGSALAASAPVAAMAPQRPGPVAAEHQPRSDLPGPLAYVPRLAGPPHEQAPAAHGPEYNPHVAGMLAQEQSQTTAPPPTYTPRPAGPERGVRVQPTSTTGSPTSTTEGATTTSARGGTSTTEGGSTTTTSGATSSTRRETTTTGGQPTTTVRETTTTGRETTTTGRESTTTGRETTTTERATSTTAGATSTTEGGSTTTGASTTTAPPTMAPGGNGPPNTAVPTPTEQPSTTASPPSTTISPPSTAVPTPTESSTTTTRPPTTTTSPPSTTSPPGGGGGGGQPAPSPQPPQAPATRSHRVIEGDNLWTIARDHLAAVTNRQASELSDHEIASYWLRVIAVNRASLRSGNPDLIFPGELIMLPPVR